MGQGRVVCTAALLGQIPSRTEPCRGRIRTGLGPGAANVQQDTSGAVTITAHPHPGLGQAGLRGRDAGYGAATAPGRPVLVTGSGSSQKKL